MGETEPKENFRMYYTTFLIPPGTLLNTCNNENF